MNSLCINGSIICLWSFQLLDCGYDIYSIAKLGYQARPNSYYSGFCGREECHKVERKAKKTTF